MSGKTIFIVIASVLVTIVLMNNTEEIDFWLFGATKIPKLVILGTMLGLGFVIGVIAARPKKKEQAHKEPEFEVTLPEENRSPLSDEDRDYIN
ncbi:hypothetical protein WG906_17625 [Pedobacter sp. P351]|uniref:hypothetical protein n=1 Tax=Pedobacter superstes TaxID=3133441 RepID=UPI0030A9E920